MAYKLSLKAQFEIKDVKRDPYDIYTWFKNIDKSLLKVSPLIWAQKACQKLSKLTNLAQFEAQTRLTDESDPFNR